MFRKNITIATQQPTAAKTRQFWMFARMTKTWTSPYKHNRIYFWFMLCIKHISIFITTNGNFFSDSHDHEHLCYTWFHRFILPKTYIFLCDFCVCWPFITDNHQLFYLPKILMWVNQFLAQLEFFSLLFWLILFHWFISISKNVWICDKLVVVCQFLPFFLSVYLFLFIYTAAKWYESNFK